MHSLVITDITKHFRGLTALAAVSFEAAPGKITAVIGPNGAGKTTLFNVMTGFLSPDAGTITYGPHRLLGMSPARIARLGVVRTFQDVRIFERLTVPENLAIGARGDGLERARMLLEEMMSGNRWLDGHDTVGGLGYGQQKLVAIARVVAAQGDALLLDEPASGLDDDSLTILANVIRRLRDEGKLVLLVEHNMEFVMNLSDAVVVLASGQVLARGTPGEVQANEEVIAAYLGTTETEKTVSAEPA
jgi:ABC-type branched-subunit amino acid transport system ATPase component